MSNEDKDLMQQYYQGFFDELSGQTSKVSSESLDQVAYHLGAFHANDLIFDDLTSDEIIKLIKG